MKKKFLYHLNSNILSKNSPEDIDSYLRGRRDFCIPKITTSSPVEPRNWKQKKAGPDKIKKRYVGPD